MELLNLDKCTTNEEVCKLVKARVDSFDFSDVLKHVNKQFTFQHKAAKAIYTGLSDNMNVFLSGPGGYGKSALIKYLLEYFGIPYTTIVGYKDMPVDALLGIPNMDKLLKESRYELNFKDSIFCKPGVIIGEEFTDILPSTAAALKDILSERGLRTDNGKIESLTCCMMIAANKSADEVSDDESKRAFYMERFPISVEVTWTSYTAKNYFDMLKLHFPKTGEESLYFMGKLFEENHKEFSTTTSPRLAIAMTKVYLSKGIAFLDNFNINLSSIIMLEIQARKEYRKKSFVDYMASMVAAIKIVKEPQDKYMACMHAINKINSLVLVDELKMVAVGTVKEINGIASATNYFNADTCDIDNLIDEINA